MTDTNLELAPILARMNLLLDEYRDYDITTSIIASWCYHIHNRYRDVAMFDCVQSIGELDTNGTFNATTKPDFFITFPGHDYGIIGEIKASLSRNLDTLADLTRQGQRYCQTRFSFPQGPGSIPFTPSKQDLIIIVPAESVSPAGQALQRDVTPQHGQHLCLCQFSRSQHGESIHYNHHPLPAFTGKDNLRDSFLVEHRVSYYLQERAIELRLENYVQYVDRLIAGSDGLTSSLGILTKILEAMKEIYGKQIRRTRFNEEPNRRHIAMGIDDLNNAIRNLPYRCGVPRRQILETLKEFAAGSPHFDLLPGGRNISFLPQKARRYTPFTKDEILSSVPEEYRIGELPHRAFCLAKGQLRIEEVEALSDPSDDPQLSFPF